jgi:hypothetical protein
MKKFITKTALTALSAVVMTSATVNAQNSADTTFKPGGKIWGYAFGDYTFKAKADTAGFTTLGKYRGGSNQYTNANYANNGLNMSMFQFRRVYLGYDYNISSKFSAEFLLAAEDDFNTAGAASATGGINLAPNQNGDVLANNKFAPYIKLANIRWKRIFPGADLVIGQIATPAFPMMSEAIWSYRSVERTITDIRRTPSFDMGASLQGRFIPSNDNFGYNLMVGNGQSAKPENDMYKSFYGDVYAKFFEKHLVVDLYSDYTRLNQSWNTTLKGMWNHERDMVKLFVAWTEPKFTVGVEYFMNTLLGDDFATTLDGKGVQALTTKATGLSIFARAKVYKDKLNAFARFDSYDPTSGVDATKWLKFAGQTSQYDPNTSETFMTFGLDFTPIKNVHIMPNVWINNYHSVGYSALNSKGQTSIGDGTDMSYRLTFYYIYGK